MTTENLLVSLYYTLLHLKSCSLALQLLLITITTMSFLSVSLNFCPLSSFYTHPIFADTSPLCAPPFSVRYLIQLVE